ncbi:MAG: cupin domain-containing protein [Clostridiales bacterium]|nr:cupin domain-containing protein [Clostridiales bacterium]
MISGTATLKTPDGEKTVTEGDVIVFPANANGAHQLINNSDDILVYVDIDTVSSPEVVFFPDKGDFRIATSTAHKNFPLNAEVNYLRNE